VTLGALAETSPGEVSLQPGLLPACRDALAAADRFVAAAKQTLSDHVTEDGRVSSTALEQHQFAAHGFAWMATYVEALRQSLGWAERLENAGNLGDREALQLQMVFGEYLAQLAGGIAMSQGEVVRPADLGMDESEVEALRRSAPGRLITQGNTAGARADLADLIAESPESGDFGNLDLDETLALIRDQFRRFSDEKIMPYAHRWHVDDVLIPIEIIDEMSELGVFGLTIPEEYGGLALGKTAMCVVSEELSRGYIGIGSLGTRSEIAAELIRIHGTDAQKARWLSRLASGEILPTAVFTEPNVGSDMGSLRTRAIREGDAYRVTGNKTWITHGARSDMMTLLARTDSDEPGYRGLSMFIAEKPRGTDDDPFPAVGMSGGEIRVLGYRGMKEYEISFDGFEVPADCLLGEEEGNGFKQLMATFESARIQTAARAIGVAQSALETGLRYARERQQFGKEIYAFPRVHGKLAWAAAEIMAARQLTHFAAREKDAERRCDLEAGMAKLLAARVAWSAADNAVQIHGGNGYAEEFPISRIMCDARILNIFEGAAEIQAQVIARRLLESRN
jgi:(2S)-methylsuccinyl-CoA dehydrogenase